MEDSTKNGYIAGVVCSVIAAFLILMAINIGWNLSGQFMGIFGLLFGGMGIGSLWRPESIGQIASQILENMQENAREQNRPRSTKKVTTQIIARGDVNVNNITDSKNTKINSPNKSKRKPKVKDS